MSANPPVAGEEFGHLHEGAVAQEALVTAARAALDSMSDEHVVLALHAVGVDTNNKQSGAVAWAAIVKVAKNMPALMALFG